MMIAFGKPEHGWMLVQLGGHKMFVSDVPCDSLFHLVTCLGRLADGSEAESVDWSLEPDYATWMFARVGVHLEFRCRRGAHASPVLVAKAPAEDILASIVAALDRLGAEPCWNADAAELRIWSWRFPMIALERLKTTLRRSAQRP